MSASFAMEMRETRVVPAIAVQGKRPQRRRSISPQAGRALRVLGHAIEYLPEEFVLDHGTFSERDAQLQAVRILMAKNREIYFACPELPSLRERCLLWMQMLDA